MGSAGSDGLYRRMPGPTLLAQHVERRCMHSSCHCLQPYVVTHLPPSMSGCVCAVCGCALPCAVARAVASLLSSSRSVLPSVARAVWSLLVPLVLFSPTAVL